MRIYGVDFTSAPTAKKPIACAVCELEEDTLALDCFVSIANFDVFDNFLASEGPWVACLDFPFGQPRELIHNLGWPSSWEGYVRALGCLSREQFSELLKDYSDRRPSGSKHHLRAADRVAGARSPMMWHGIPVGRMFFEGAPRLERSGASVLPMRPGTGERTLLEGYPALVARRWIGRRSYKGNPQRGSCAVPEAARWDIVRSLSAPVLEAVYGLNLMLPAAIATDLVEDPGADNLDALMCAIQGAWACSRRGAGYGIPPWADPLEGWIVDPAMLNR